MKYAWIQDHSKEFPVAVMCRVLQVSTSGYYDWVGREPSNRHQQREALKEAVRQSHEASKKVYGYRKVHRDVVEQTTLTCCEETVRSVMKELNLRARSKRKYVVTTDSKHELPVASNLLECNFEPEGPNEKWVADITYIRTYEGWLYLAAVMDLFGRRIVGWQTSEHIDADLVISALHDAIRKRHPGAGLLHHSDRGCQYASVAFQEQLGLMNMTCSMSRKGNCWDNACMERFFKSLKGEWIGDMIFTTREMATAAIFDYIEMFYNTKRRHAALDYLAPAEFEARAIAHGTIAA